MKKILALSLSFCLLFSSLMPAWAVGADLAFAEDAFSAALERAIAEQIPDEEWATQPRQIEIFILYQNADLFAQMHGYPEHSKYLMNDLLESCYKSAMSAKVNGDVWKGTVKTYQWLANAGQYMQVCLDMALQDGWNGTYVTPDALASHYPMAQNRLVVRHVKQVGVSEAGVERAYRYLTGLLTISDVCDEQDTDPNRRPHESQCEVASDAMEALAIVGMQHPSYKEKIANAIYNFMADKNRSKMGQAAVYQGALLLIALGKHNKLKTFLQDHAHQTGGGWFLHELGYFSLEGIAALIHENKDYTRGEYLNSYTRRYSYLDTKLGDAWLGKGTCAAYETAVTSVRNQYQCPYGNLYEELGMAIAQDSNHSQTASLAQWIWQNRGSLPAPLTMGLLTGGKGKWTFGAGGEEAKKELYALLSVDYTDMNEGSQRRLKIAVAEALQAHGVDDVKVSDYATRDYDKFTRYATQQWHRTVLGMFDLTLAVILLPRLLLSLGTLGARGLAALGKITHIRRVQTWGTKTATVLRQINAPASTVKKAASTSKAVSSATPAVATATPAVVEVAPVAATEQIAATGEASMKVALSEQKAAASIARMQSQVKQFSLADKQLFLNNYRFNLAQQYQIARQTGTKLSLVQREDAFYRAFQPVFQAQKEAVYSAELDALARAYTATAFTQGRVITHIPWSVRFEVGMSSLWSDVKAGLKGTLTDPRGFGSMLGVIGVGDPAFTMATTQAGASMRGLSAPIVMVADYAGGMGSKLTTLRSTVAPGLNAPRNLGMSVWSAPLSKSVVSPFSSGIYSFAEQVGPRVLFPLGVGSFTGQFNNAVVRSAYQQSPVEADGLFALQGQEYLLAGVQQTAQKKFDAQQFQQQLLPYLNTGLILGMNGFLAKWTNQINNLSLSQKITSVVEEAYNQAVAYLPNGDEKQIESKFREILTAQLTGDLASYQEAVFAALGWQSPSALAQQEEEELLRQQIEHNVAQRQKMVDQWRGVLENGFENFASQEKNLALAAQAIVEFYHLEKEMSAVKKQYSSKYGSAGISALKIDTYKEPCIFDITFRGRIIAAYHQSLKKQVDAETDPEFIDFLEEKRKQAIDWHDEVMHSWHIYPANHALSDATALRKYLKELGKQKESFSEEQVAEYEMLAYSLYSKIHFVPEETIPLQNRLVMLPKMEKTAHSVFLIGDDFSALDIWDRKTALGFANPVFIQNKSVEEAVKHFVPNKENVLLAHLHGGVNKNGIWKAALVWPDQSLHPQHSLSAAELMRQLATSKSAHTSVYMNACFSGHFLNDLQAPHIQEQYADVLAHTDFYVTASKNQRTMPEELPADWVQGTTRQKLFGKVLQRIRYNGDGLAARVVVDGQEIYPLQESVKRLEEENKGLFVSREKKEMLKALTLLLELANAEGQENVMSLVQKFEKDFMGHVVYFGNSDRDGFAAFSWGIDDLDYYDTDFDFPFIVLEKQWVDYVYSVAVELFGKVGNISLPQPPAEPVAQTPAPKIYTAADFTAEFYSETTKYIFKMMDISQPLYAVPSYYSTTPIIWPDEEQIKALKMDAADYNKYIIFKQSVEDFRKELSSALYYVKKNVNQLDMTARRELQDRLADLRSELNIFHRRGLELNSVEDWLNFSLETVAPKLKGQYMDLPVFSRPDREYDSYKFFLYNTLSEGALRRTTLDAQAKLFPKGIKVAVINDTPEILVRYKNLFTSTVFLEKENWSFYSGLTDFSKAIMRGEKFDLVITDLNFTDGGASYIVAYLRNEGYFDTTIIAASSMPESGLEEYGANLFERGFDGYLSSIHMQREDGGQYLIQALNNYFKFKEKENWAR